MHWTNYHCHSLYCDGKARMEDFVLEAIKIGMPILGFTGHGPVPFKSVWNMTADDLPKYLDDVQGLKEKYADKITILSGLEIDYVEGELNAKSEIFNCGLDFKIGSLHYLNTFEDGSRFTIDGPPAEWQAGLTQLYDNNVFNVVEDFKRQSIDMIELGGFEILGHMDKTFQHGHKHFPIDHPQYIAAITDILKSASENDIVVEINTKSHERLGFLYPHVQFFKTLKSFDIPVTINSDSHHPLLLTSGMEFAANALLEAGINETYEFSNGNWVACALDKKGIALKH